MDDPLTVEYTIQARTDLWGIRTYIAQNNPSAADRVLAVIDAEIELLRYFPWNSRRTDEEGVLARTISRYPYIIFFSVEGDLLVVLHVLHGARRHPGFQEGPRAFAR